MGDENVPRAKKEVLSEEERLELICDAVRYCRNVSQKGMPKRAYSPALREAIYFLWEAYGKKKSLAAQFVSTNADGISFGTGKVTYDHAIPFQLIRDRLMQLEDLSSESVRHVLEFSCIAAKVTKEEEEILRRLKLAKAMPEGWTWSMSPLARYQAAGITVVKNKDYSR